VIDSSRWLLILVGLNAEFSHRRSKTERRVAGHLLFEIHKGNVVVVGLLERGNEPSLIAEPFGGLFQRHPRGQHGFQSRAQLRVHVCNNRLAVLPPPTSAALSVIGIVGIATPRLLFGLIAGVCRIALVIATAAASIAPSRIASRLITGVALFAVRITTANSTAVATTAITAARVTSVAATRIAGVSTTGVAGIATAGITGIAATRITRIAATRIAGIATTRIAGVSTTGIAGISTTGIAGISTTGIAGISTTGIAGVSTTALATGLPSRCRYLATG
jgi:hypothetical protein